MKKTFLSIVFLLLFYGITHAQSKWNIGIHNGCVTNVAKFDGGDEEANALFTSQPTKSLNLSVTARYKISERFAIHSGLNFTEFGFTYALSRDYSLLKPFDRDETINSSTCITSIPFLAVLNTPANCNNVRFIFGLGFSVRGIDENWSDEQTAEIETDESGSAKVTSLTARSNSINTVSASATWMIGIEKLLRSGNSFTFTYQGNQGFGSIAESQVGYTIDNRQYMHKFRNRGSFVSFSLGYNFMPFGSRKAKKALEKVESVPQIL